MEKVFWFALVAVVLALALVVCAFAVYGDIYKDGKVNANDAVKLAQKLAKWDIEFTAEDEKNADVFYDGVLNAADAVKLAQFLAGWDVKLGPKGEDVEIDGDDLFDETTGEAGTTSPETTAPAPDTTVPEDTTTTTPEPEPEPDPDEGRLPFKAGINLNGMETFLSENQYGFFEYGIRMTTAESTYTNIKSQGFDYVRIPINFYTIYYEATKYNYTSEQLMQNLDKAIELALAQDLYVMIDFHGWFYIGEDQNDYDEFLYCWTQVANRYKDVSEKVVFELLNEPWYTNGKAQTYLSDSRLNTMQAEAVKIIRNTGSKNADRLIILCTADGNKAWKLDKLVLPDDDNIAVAIHEYAPYNFTHQNFGWAGLSGKTTTLAEQGGFASATSWDFSQIKKFMANNPEVPIIMNEFGLNLSKASAADAREYLSGITSFCKENDIPWAYWQYDSNGYSSEGAMALYRQNSYWGSAAWDQNALDALFLR